MGSPVAERPRGDLKKRAHPSASLAASVAGLPEVSSMACGSCVADAAAAARKDSSSVLVEDVTRIHSPDVLLVDPAFGATGGNLAGLRAAGLELRNYAGLSQGQNGRIRLFVRAKSRGLFRCHEHGPVVRNH